MFPDPVKARGNNRAINSNTFIMKTSYSATKVIVSLISRQQSYIYSVFISSQSIWFESKLASRYYFYLNLLFVTYIHVYNIDVKLRGRQD